MSIYRVRFIQANTKKLRSWLLGSIIGTVGCVATLVRTNFEIPLRIISIAILVFTYFMIVKDLNIECKVKFDKFRD